MPSPDTVASAGSRASLTRFPHPSTMPPVFPFFFPHRLATIDHLEIPFGSLGVLETFPPDDFRDFRDFRAFPRISRPCATLDAPCALFWLAHMLVGG